MATGGMRLDDLARKARVPTTTIRLYQTKGLLPPPRLDGRTGYYDDAHLARLRLIARLQEQGFSLAGIARVLATWETGRDLEDLVGDQALDTLDALLGKRREVVLDAMELAQRLPADVLTPKLMRRAIALGLVEPLDDGRFRVPDPRFLDTGAALVDLGVPATAILDEWERLSTQTDEIAARFVSVFERHLLPKNWRRTLDADQTKELARTLARLRRLAIEVTDAALEASIAKLARQRLTELVDDAG